MYEYTAKKSIVRIIQKSLVKNHYSLLVSLLASHGVRKPDFTDVCTAEKYLPKIKFYSKKQERFIPVNGIMFPASMFEITKIEE